MKFTKPTHGVVVAYLALFIAMTGTATAATGGSFTLGKSNSANKASSLANTSGTPLSLQAKTGFAPLRVNSSTKVLKLNADKLDGFDSTSFVRTNNPALTSKTLASFVSVQTVFVLPAYTSKVPNNGFTGAFKQISLTVSGTKPQLIAVDALYPILTPASALSNINSRCLGLSQPSYDFLSAYDITDPANVRNLGPLGGRNNVAVLTPGRHIIALGYGQSGSCPQSWIDAHPESTVEISNVAFAVNQLS
jgi:hypothetical protein